MAHSVIKLTTILSEIKNFSPRRLKVEFYCTTKSGRGIYYIIDDSVPSLRDFAGLVENNDFVVDISPFSEIKELEDEMKKSKIPFKLDMERWYLLIPKKFVEIVREINEIKNIPRPILKARKVKGYGLIETAGNEKSELNGETVIYHPWDNSYVIYIFSEKNTKKYHEILTGLKIPSTVKYDNISSPGYRWQIVIPERYMEILGGNDIVDEIKNISPSFIIPLEIEHTIFNDGFMDFYELEKNGGINKGWPCRPKGNYWLLINMLDSISQSTLDIFKKELKERNIPTKVEDNNLLIPKSAGKITKVIAKRV